MVFLQSFIQKYFWLVLVIVIGLVLPPKMITLSGVFCIYVIDSAIIIICLYLSQSDHNYVIKNLTWQLILMIMIMLISNEN